MQTRRRTNVLLGLVPLAAAILLLLVRLGAFPVGMADLVKRAWPLLLVVIGLLVLLRERLALGGLAALVFSGLLMAGIMSFAYSSRQDELRTDQELTLSTPIDEQTALLVLNIELLQTDLDLRVVETGAQVIEGTFTGSLSSQVRFDCTEGEVTECTFVEEKPEQYPPLDEVGRGVLSLRVPTEFPLAVAFAGVQGSATFDLNATQLERLAVDLEEGNILLTLPAYQPLSPSAINDPGQIVVQNGDLTVVVPENLNARLKFDRRGSNIDPEFHPAYIEQRDGVDGMLRRDDESGDINLEYEIIIPRGLLRLDVSTN